MAVIRSLIMIFLGLGDTKFCERRRCSYSRLNALPTGEDPMEPLQTRYAVMMERNLLDLPRSVCPLHRPRPVGSVMGSPCDIGTSVPVVMVMLPPDWNVSFSGTKSVFSVGNPNEIFAAP